ncbi:hypothetical protein [Spongiactinospora sp. TRM90649]|uniref:hypothetical protein n=1 Tax=Spongiactinospora sp. TRM90649 TaxID=3031114 RepID=UPI0023FA2199|nr:hypothetical protein [Spongiactinospora sp. TRM90649]MDF5756015.1 hypothetical protein [Spongiactinospora sp. TRM90649]
MVKRVDEPDARPDTSAWPPSRQAPRGVHAPKRGLALLGEFSTCFALLDEAAEILRDHPQVSHSHVPVYLHHYDFDTLTEQGAICRRMAGRADMAMAILEAQIGKLPDAATRDRGHLTAKLAVTVTQDSNADLGRAALLGHEALDIAHQTGSARIRRELEELDRELAARWPDTNETHTFHEAMHAA